MANPVTALARIVSGATEKKASAPLQAVRKDIYPAPALLPFSRSIRAVFTNWDADRAIAVGFKSSAPVYVAVRKLAEAAASVPWVAVKRGRNGIWTPDPDHPLGYLLEHPNPYISRYELIERLVAHLYLTGNGLAKKVIISRTMQGASEPVVTELWPLQSHGIAPVPDPKVFIREYVYRGSGGQQKKFPAQEIVHILFMDPANPFWGMAPLMAAAKDVDVQIQSVEWNMYALQNRAIADGAFVSKEPMSEEQYKEAKAQIEEQHQGPVNAHEPWVLGGGWDWKQMSLSPVEMDFIASSKVTRDQIFSVFGVPPVVAGFFDDATLANASIAKKMFWTDAAIPLLERLRIALERSLVPHFGDPNKLGLRYDLSGVEALREDFEAKARAFYMFQKAGVPYNESGRIVGLSLEDQGADGDKPFGLVGGEQRQQIAVNQPAGQAAPESPRGEGKEPARGPLPEAAAAGSGSDRDNTKSLDLGLA